MSRPRALDLFCGAGGVSVGLERAGFDVTGVDIAPQPHHRGGRFIQADALTFPLEGYDFIWASPPCQRFTQMSARWRGRGGKADSHPDLLTPTIARLLPVETPWAIENVVGARRVFPRVDLTLHGGIFGLRVHRPRLFMLNFLVLAPKAAACVDPIGVYGARADGRRLFTRKDMNGKVSAQRAAHSATEACEAMGIDHGMNWEGVKNAIPPAYAEHIGRYAMLALKASR